jgi:glucokinase
VTASGALLLGVDIGGTKTAVVVSATPPEVLGRVEIPTEPERGPQHAIDSIVEAGLSLLAGAVPAAVGVSCGSPLDRVRGIIQAPPNLTTWIDVPICRLLSQAFQAPCRLENDANAGAVAEHRYGAGVGADHIVFLTLGTGLGAGIIAGGRLYLGASGDAGEIGHVRLSARGPVGYHKAGSIEGWSSGGGIAQLVRKARVPGMVSARDLGREAKAGNPVALAILRKSGERLGQTLAMLVDVLNPQRIVLGGLAWRLGEPFMGPMRRVLQREALPQTLAACEVVPAALGEKIGDIAARCVAEGLLS